ncbi:MAG: site-specific integrase [Selenomonas sp.]|nr:site-specific integrase [Selenomonas sp.]
MPSYKYQNAAGRVMWFCSFYYKDYSGRRVKKKKQGFQTKREADAFERDFLTRKTGSPSMTFRQLMENYLEDARARLKPTTIQGMETDLSRHVVPVFGDMPVDEITPAAVRQWENDELARGAALVSVKRYRREFSAALNFAGRFYGLSSNPVRAAGAIKATGRRQEEKRLHVWMQEQFARFILSGLSPEHIAVFSVLFWTGCREGEALALTTGDVDFSTSTLSITKTVEPLNGRRFRAQSPKTSASVRRVSMPAQLAAILADWIRLTDARRPADMLFRFCTRNSLGDAMRRGAKKAGLPRIRVHDLRHSHASMLVDMGIPPIVIRDRLGHSDIKTTMNVYSHLYPRAMDDVAARLSSMEIEK